MTRTVRSLAVVVPSLAAAVAAVAQAAPPFFGTGAVAFEPEVGFIHAGIMREAQGIVSPDRKYVTLGASAVDQRTLGFAEFNVQRTSGMGTLGHLGEPGHAPSLLDREGITRVEP